MTFDAPHDQRTAFVAGKDAHEDKPLMTLPMAQRFMQTRSKAYQKQAADLHQKVKQSVAANAKAVAKTKGTTTKPVMSECVSCIYVS